jgi:hypothetical protein
MKKEKSIAEEMAEQRNKDDLTITLTVTKEGRLGMQSDPPISDNEFRSVLLEAIVATIINNSVNATKETMQKEMIQKFDAMGGKLGVKQ